MENILQQIFSLLITPPGNLIYHLVVSFAIIAAVQAVLIAHRTAQTATAGRYLLGLGLMILSQIGLFMVTGLAWQGYADLRTILPPLDRAISLVGLLLIIWMWAFSRPHRIWDGLFIFLLLISAVAFLYTLTNWSIQSAGLKFNGTLFDQTWELALLFISLTGLLALVIRRPDGWGIGLGFLTVNLIGHTVQFIWPDVSVDLSGVVRLAQLCSYPLLPSLALQLQDSSKSRQSEPSQITQEKPGVFKERRKHSADPRTVFVWLQLATENDPQKSYANLSRAIAQTMLADLCFLVSSPSQEGNLIFHGGYDLIREQEIPSTMVSRDRVPTLANAVLRSRAIRLGGDIAPSPDLKALAQEFSLEDCGNLLLIPLSTPDHNWGAVILLSPYSNRVWSPEDQSYLLTSVESMVRFIQKPGPASPIPESQSLPTPLTLSGDLELPVLRNQVEALSEDNQLLLSELAEMREERRSINEPSSADLLQNMQKKLQDLQEENQRLVSELNAHFPAIYSEKSQEVEHLEKELRHTLEESARLQNALAESNIQILTLQKQVEQPIRAVSEDREVIASSIQELRQPMATITGYTELILSESAGILGTLQRKFLERVKGSSERMRSMLDELVRLTSIQNAPLELIAHPLDPGEVIDRAIADTRAQLQEKNITLRIDLAEELPELYADQDAFYQVIVQLLQNAIGASPSEGVIHLVAAIEGGASQSPHFLFQVTDSGGGVDPNDLQKVFSRRYRADHALIQGVGDSGVGLSIAKTLVEAQNGRIWVDTQVGKTTTFSILLPIRFKGDQVLNPSDETTA